jgi:hypothetical protein
VQILANHQKRRGTHPERVTGHDQHSLWPQAKGVRSADDQIGGAGIE